MTAWALTLYLAASVARCESSAAYADGAAVLQVARNRGPLLGLLAPRQFAWACPARPRSWSPRHVVLGLQAMAGTLDAPAWARRAWFYCSKSDLAACVARGGEQVGAVVHRFFCRW